jgi:hypothetical protein
VLEVSGFVIQQFHEENSIPHESKFGMIYPLINMRMNSLSSSSQIEAKCCDVYFTFSLFITCSTMIVVFEICETIGG